MKMYRMWINAPGEYQPAHCYHGRRVLASMATTGPQQDSTTVYFVEGDTISAVVPLVALSFGWPETTTT